MKGNLYYWSGDRLLSNAPSASEGSSNIVRYSPSKANSLRAIVTQVSHWVGHILTASSEPKVTQRRDRTGNLTWRVYDPVTGQAHQFSSESEVRSWLDQRFNY